MSGKTINLDGLASCAAQHPSLPPERRCEEPMGHTGYHVVNDACGRPEFFWERR